jgi:hypothetical protein
MIYGIEASIPALIAQDMASISAAGSLHLAGVAPTAAVFNPSPNLIPAAKSILLAGQTASLFDAATVAWINAVVAAGGTVGSPRQIIVNNLVIGLKADSLWTKLDRLWILAAENSQSALIDLKNLSTATLGSPTPPTFTTNRGYAGTGAASSIIDTGFNEASGTPLLSLNDTHFSLWGLTNPLPIASTTLYCGADTGSGGSYWLYFSGDSSFYFRTNDNGAATALASAFTNHTGHFISSRASSSQRKLYQNGTLKFTSTATSTSLPNITHKIINSGAVHQVAAYSIGSNLDGGSDAVNFYNRLLTYMAAVGVPITTFNLSPAVKALTLSGQTPTAVIPSPAIATTGTLTGSPAQTTATLTMPTLLVNGNVLVAFVQLPAAGSKTFSVGGGWTIGDTDAGGNAAWAWRYVDGSEAAPVFSWGGASVAWHGQITQVQTVKATAAIGSFNKNNGTVSPISVSAVTTTGLRSLILAILLKQGNEVISVPTSFSTVAQFNDATASDRMAAETVAASGVASDTVSVAISNAVWQGFLIEIKA